MRQAATNHSVDPNEPSWFTLYPVEVPTSVGRYKKYTEKDRFRLPNTLRSIGGRAAEPHPDLLEVAREHEAGLQEPRVAPREVVGEPVPLALRSRQVGAVVDAVEEPLAQRLGFADAALVELKAGKTFAELTDVRIVMPSADRVRPPCAHARTCGGSTSPTTERTALFGA